MTEDERGEGKGHGDSPGSRALTRTRLVQSLTPQNNNTHTITLRLHSLISPADHSSVDLRSTYCDSDRDGDWPETGSEMAGDRPPLTEASHRPTRSLSASSATSSVNTQPITESQSGSDLAASWTADGARIGPGGEGEGDDVLLAVQALGLMRAGSDQGQPYHDNKPTTNHVEQSKHRGGGGVTASRSASTASHRSLSWSTSRPTPSTTASSPSRASSQQDKDAIANGEMVIDEGDPKFIARVSALPIVSGGLEWYERSKASSRVVKVSTPRTHTQSPHRRSLLNLFFLCATGSTALAWSSHPCRQSRARWLGT